MSRVISGFAAVVFWSSVAAAQAPSSVPGIPPPAPDTSTQPATAAIRGHVYDASNGKPLRKAQVRAFSPELRENRLAITDAAGAYEIKNIAAGRYQLSANKGSFVGLAYGQTRPFEQRKPLEVHAAQQLEKIDFSLPHGAIVTGRVVDEAGEPTSDVQVSILRYQYIQGRRQLTPGRFATTNDIGEFRLFGMPPGQYFVSATLRGANGPNDAQSDDRSGYAPTYYPGITNVTDAQRITLGVGQTLNDINIALSPARMARISGTAVSSDGKPITTGILMLAQTSGGFVFSSAGSQVKPDGSFTIANVAPGEYALRMLANNGPITAQGTESIQANVTVSGDDITNLQLIGVKPSRVTGRIIPPASQAGSFSFSELRLSATPAVPTLLGANGSGRASEDGTFEMLVPPGAAFIRMNPIGALASTRIKAIRLNGVDVIDTGIEFKPNEDVSGVEIELTTELSSVTGTVTDARGNSVKDYTVVIFARDRERWAFGSRYFSGGRPDQDGRYKAVNLPPGDYYAIALDYVEAGAGTDPEFLDRVKDRATQFSMTDAETKSLDLKLVTGT